MSGDRPPGRGGIVGALRNVTVLFSADLFSKLTAVALIGFYARSLTQEMLALLPLYEMLGMLTVLVASFGMVPTVMRRLPALRRSDSAQALALTTTAYRLPIGTTLVLATAIALGADRLGPLLPEVPEAERFVRIMCLGFPAMAGRRISDAVLWSAGRFPVMARVELLRTVGSIAALGFYLYAGVEGLLVGFVVRDWSTAILSRLLARDLFPSRGITAYPVFRLIGEAKAFYAESFVLYMTGNGDRWVVASLLGPAALGTYYIACRLTDTVVLMFQSADRVITTGLVHRQDDPLEVAGHLRRVLVLFSQSVVPGLFLVAGLSPTLVLLIGGQEHLGAVAPAVVLSLGALALFIRQPLGRGILAVCEPAQRLRLSAAEATVLVVALAAATPLGTLVAVASARALARIAGVLFAWRVVRSFAEGLLPSRMLLVSIGAGLVSAAGLLAGQHVQPALHVVPLHALAAGLLFLILDVLFNRDALRQAVGEFHHFR